MQCNIDARGKAVRLAAGVPTTLAGLTMGALALTGTVAMLPWGAVGVALLIVGAIMIFEGAAGWCALRAMGFKTPL
jgi:hypothetical protein